MLLFLAAVFVSCKGRENLSAFCLRMLHQHSCQTDERWADVDAKTACTYQSDHIRRCCPYGQTPTYRSLQTADWTVKRVEHSGQCPSVRLPKLQQWMFLYSGMKDENALEMCDVMCTFISLFYDLFIVVFTIFPNRAMDAKSLLGFSSFSLSKHCHNILSGTGWTTIIRQMEKTT